MKLTYIHAAMLLCAAASFASCSQKAQNAQSQPKEMALQLYSIRELIGDSATYAQNHDSVFAALRSMGYTAVETANYIDRKFYGVSPAQFRADCEAAGLRPLSAHSIRNLTPQELAEHNFTAALEWWDNAIADHLEAGMSYIIMPWCPDPKTAEEAATLCDYHNAIGQKCRAAGIRYGYHSHTDEFLDTVETPDGNIPWMDYMMQNIHPENMFWQIDTYLAVKALQSPVDYIEKYPGRFALLHLKDRHELGQSGMVDAQAILRAASDSGLEYIVVEQDGASHPHVSLLDAVALSAAYLQNAPFVPQSYRH